jgi:hypothetical protein
LDIFGPQNSLLAVAVVEVIEGLHKAPKMKMMAAI